MGDCRILGEEGFRVFSWLNFPGAVLSIGFNEVNHFLVAHDVPDAVTCGDDKFVIVADLGITSLDGLSSYTKLLSDKITDGAGHGKAGYVCMFLPYSMWANFVAAFINKLFNTSSSCFDSTFFFRIFRLLIFSQLNSR
jgi:hypothetical protein